MTWTWLSFVLSPMNNNIGDSGASSFSEALKINSSLTYLNLQSVFWIWNDMNMTIICFEFHEQQHWWFRSIILVRSIEDQFIPNLFEPAECVCKMEWHEHDFRLFWVPMNNNMIGDSGASSLSEALKINSSLTHLNIKECSW